MHLDLIHQTPLISEEPQFLMGHLAKPILDSDRAAKLRRGRAAAVHQCRREGAIGQRGEIGLANPFARSCNDHWVNVKVREIIVVIESDGWIQTRQKGSHRQFHHPTNLGTVTVAGNLGRDLRLGTLIAIFKQAGIDRRMR